LDLLDEIFGVFTAFTLLEFTSQIFRESAHLYPDFVSMSEFIGFHLTKTAPLVIRPMLLILSAIWFREITDKVRPSLEKLCDDAFIRKGNFRSNLRKSRKGITRLLFIGIVTFISIYFIWLFTIDFYEISNPEVLKISVQIAMFGTLLWTVLRVIAFSIIPNIVPQMGS
jgi:hypothetical protein